jgi:hypothetical protein
MNLSRNAISGIMAMRAGISVLITLLLFFVNTPLLAQEDATKTFITDDQSFSFNYPEDWTVEVVNADQGPNAHLSVDSMSSDQRFESPEWLNIQISLPKKSFMLGASENMTPKEVVANSVAGSQQVSLDFATQLPGSTPQPLQFEVTSPEITEFLVDGRPAAYAYNISNVMGMDASSLISVVDLGQDTWVHITAISFKGGLETLKRYEQNIKVLIESMRYTPPAAIDSGNPDLPQVYSGFVGIWQRGYITFYYPESWYANYSLAVFVTNFPGNPLNATPESGQFIAVVNGVSETRTAAEPDAFFDQCNTVRNDLTARTVVEKMLGNMTPDQLTQIADAGIVMTQPEVTLVNGKEIVYLRRYQEDFEMLDMFIDLGKGYVPSMTATAKKGEMTQFEDQLFAVAGTFQYEPKPCDLQMTATPTGS